MMFTQLIRIQRIVYLEREVERLNREISRLNQESRSLYQLL
jgi:hypothetical protein